MTETTERSARSSVAQAPASRAASASFLARWRLRWRRVFLAEKWWLVRRDLAAPLERAPEPPGEGIEFRRATPADIEVWREERAHKLELYRERLKYDNPFVTIGLCYGKLVSTCWFSAGGYRDPELGYTFHSDPGGVYLFEAWVSPAWREKRIATQNLEWCCTYELPRLGFTHALSYYADSNTASQRLHAHFGYRVMSRLWHVRILGRHFFFERKVEARPSPK